MGETDPLDPKALAALKKIAQDADAAAKSAEAAMKSVEAADAAESELQKAAQ